MTKTPADRLARLSRHARAGWRRASGDTAVRERAAAWLRSHLSAMRDVDDLWFQALDGQGPLAHWLSADAAPETWSHPTMALHSALACHPFPDLPQWTEVPK